MTRWLLVTSLVLVSSAGASQGQALEVKFAEPIAAFEQADRSSPSPARGILFIGSSIVRQWQTLPEQMAPLPVYIRGFGGARTHEVLAYMDRIVLPYRPRVIVYYCGSNDINANVPPAQTAANFRTFVERMHKAQPGTRTLFVSIKGVPQQRDRWGRSPRLTDSVQKEGGCCGGLYRRRAWHRPSQSPVPAASLGFGIRGQWPWGVHFTSAGAQLRRRTGECAPGCGCTVSSGAFGGRSRTRHTAGDDMTAGDDAPAIRLLLVYDHALFRDGLIRVLSNDQEFLLVGSQGSREGGLAEVSRE